MLTAFPNYIVISRILFSFLFPNYIVKIHKGFIPECCFHFHSQITLSKHIRDSFKSTLPNTYNNFKFGCFNSHKYQPNTNYHANTNTQLPITIKKVTFSLNWHTYISFHRWLFHIIFKILVEGLITMIMKFQKHVFIPLAGQWRIDPIKIFAVFVLVLQFTGPN